MFTLQKKMHGRVMIKMICKTCGKTFTQTHHSQKYCSDQCRKTARKIQNNQSKIRWRKKQTKKILIKCRWCGKHFLRDKKSKRRFFCCEKCKKEMDLKNNRDRQFKYYNRWRYSIHKDSKKYGLGTGGLGKHPRKDFEDEKK